MLLRFSMLALSLVATTAFSFSGLPAVNTRCNRCQIITMGQRNALKAMKLRTKRVKNNMNGRLRLNVYKSNEHIYAQIINDMEGNTVLSMSSVNLKLENGGNKEAATTVGQALGEAAKQKGLDKLFFDRESASHKYMYHGRIAALVDGVREKDIQL